MDIISFFENLRIKKKISVGGISEYLTSTHRDLHGDKLTIKALISAKKALEDMPFMFNEHDISKPPIGILKSSEIKKLEDGEYGLYAEHEIFDQEILEEIKNGKKGGFSISFVGK